MKSLVSARHLPLFAAAAILLLLLTAGSLHFENFASASNFSNLLGDYAYIGIAAVGATLVIISGGIDLAVSSIIAFTAVLMATLISKGMHPLLAAAICLVIGTLCGIINGRIIATFALPPFLVTLSTMFAMRAACFLVQKESLTISHPLFPWINQHLQFAVAGASISLPTILFLLAVAIGITLARSTRLGRNIYAIGGHEPSARLMGVRIESTKISVYAISGFCSALAGLVFTMYKQAGDPTAAIGLELPIIAAVAIGGTLLSGGVGTVLGTFLGVMILGTIRLLIDFQGNLNSAWTSIAIGLLLLLFLCMQKMIGALSRRSSLSNTK